MKNKYVYDTAEAESNAQQRELESQLPEGVEEEHLVYLDNLRESGVTNMWGAGAYLQSRFAVKRKDATTILMYWMESFEERHPHD